MPRVIVLGDYSAYSSEIRSLTKSDENYLAKVATTVASTIRNAVVVYTETYEQILTRHLAKQSKFADVFLSHLGKEVTDVELSNYKA